MAIVESIKSAVKTFFSPSEEEDEKPSKQAYSVLNLHQSQSSGDLLNAHRSVMDYYMPSMEQRERFYDAVRPETQWSEEEKAVLTAKKKAIIAFNKMKSSERAFIGSMIQNKYDIKPAPTEPTDQNIADVIAAMYHHTAFITGVRFKDVGMLRNAWIGGNSWQESYVEMGPGQKPRICVSNQNNFAIYPDPNRRDLVFNEDCQFIDRAGWYSMDDLISAYPEKEGIIREALSVDKNITYSVDKPQSDRQHEYYETKNGRYKVIERFYRVFKRRWYSVDEDGEKETIGYDVNHEDRDGYLNEHQGRRLYSTPEEFLHLAVACTSISGYLYNGPYHVQPKNHRTGRIMFPLCELVDEDVGGVPSGHVEHLIGPQKAVNAMAVNSLAQAKNASGVSHLIHPKYFDEAGVKDVAENLSDGSRTFVMRTDAPDGTPVTLVPQGSTGPDTSRSLDFALSVMEDNSSTPPSLKGYSEGNVPAQLNEQRIQQSFTQSMVQVTNNQSFLTQRATLWMAYWFEVFDQEEVIRVVQKSDPKAPDFITINQLVLDQWGKVSTRNSMQDVAKYDIVFEDSWQSPSMRDKVRQQIAQMLQSSAVQGDPVLNTNMWYYFLQMTDAPIDLKEFVKKHSQVMQQKQEAKDAAEIQGVQAEAQGMKLDDELKQQQLMGREASAAVPQSPL